MPVSTVDTTLVVTPTPFVPAYRSYPFVFVDTTYASFQSTPVSAIDGCDLSTGSVPSSDETLVIHLILLSGVVNIHAPWPIEELSITDAVGRVVHRSKPGVGQVAITLLASGLHVLRATDAHGRIVTRRLVKE
ncbi:MAG: hypothetical protein IPO17_01035 [Flavobacteriales bacterium]|nr:hypothetical protein [Flavobacteriales bacterium]